MIAFYKIGYKNYVTDTGIVDKNAGLFEYELIQDELKDIVSHKKILVIVNGKFVKNEEQRLLDYMRFFDRKIFIASDIIAFSDNTTIIRNCDVLLHQSVNDSIEGFENIDRYYSYLPEAFYNHTSKFANRNKDRCLIFGGGVRDNEKIIKEYLNAVPSTAYCKTDTVDNRLSYIDYTNELAKHKYSLIISRKKYTEMNWVTSRYIEALAVNTLPLCHFDYDKLNHFEALKIDNPTTLKNVIDVLEDNTEHYNKLLEHLQSKVICNRDTFKDLVKLIVRRLS